jgi:DNA polymerase III subunit beta
MKAHVDTSALAGALASLPSIRGLELRVIQMVRVEAEGATLRLTRTDLDRWHTVQVVAEVEGPGTAMMEPSVLEACVKAATSERATIEGRGDGPHRVSAGRARAEVPGAPVDDWPAVAEDDIEELASLPGSELAEAVNATAFVCSNEISRPLLNCVHLREKDGTLRFEASDGHRGAHFRTEHRVDEGTSVMVHHRWARDIAALASRAGDELVRISSGRGWVLVEAEGESLRLKRTGGAFPELDKVTPDMASLPVRAEMEASEVLRACALSLASAPDNYTTQVDLYDGCALFRSFSQDKGRAEATVECEELQGDITLALNVRYLQEIVRRSGAERVRWGLTSPMRATLLEAVDLPVSYLLMPHRMRDDGLARPGPGA